MIYIFLTGLNHLRGYLLYASINHQAQQSIAVSFTAPKDSVLVCISIIQIGVKSIIICFYFYFFQRQPKRGWKRLSVSFPWILKTLSKVK